jgi:hypothetical protein
MTDMLVGMGRLAPAFLYPVVPGAHWVADWTLQPKIPPPTHNPSGRTVALRLTQPLTEINQEYFLGGQGGRCVGLTALPLSCADCFEIWETRPPGTLWACQGL